MNILVKKCNEPCFVKKVDKLELEDMQALVGGWIECLECNVGKDGSPRYVDMWINEEGKMHNLSPNLALTDGDKVVDVVMGDVFFTAHDGEGNTVGLSEFDIDLIRMKLGTMYPVRYERNVTLVQNFAYGR